MSVLAEEREPNADLSPKDWSTDSANTNWSSDAYSPSNIRPNYGDDFNQDGTPKSAGESNVPYDSYSDPSHPLKNPNKPPSTWINRVTVDEDGDGNPDLNENGKPKTLPAPRGQVFPEDGSPPVSQEIGDIDWGTKYYDGRFQQPLNVTNKCASEQPVQITVSDLPYLTLPKNITVGAGETKQIIGNVVLPSEPPPPLRLGLPGEPGWGWVDFPQPAPSFPPIQLHQPNFVQIKGKVELWHPWAPAAAGDCLPKLTTYNIVGHIHFRPPAPDSGGDQGPSRIAESNPCTLWWNLAAKPGNLVEDCTIKLRELARHFTQKVLGPYVYNEPDDWLWLPSDEELNQMNEEQLISMKQRAERVLGW